MDTSLTHTSLTTLAGLTGGGVFQVDESRNIVFVSDEMVRLTGFSRDEVLGRSCLDLVRCQQCLRGCGVFEHGQVDGAQLTLFRKDGTELRVVKSGQTLTDETGRIIGAVEVIRPELDGGDTAPATQPNRRPAQVLDRLLRGLGRMFLVAGTDLVVTDASPELVQAAGVAPEQLEGVHLESLFGSDLFGPSGSLTRVLAGGQKKEGCWATLRARAGRAIPVSISVAPIAEEPGCTMQGPGVVVMIRQEEEHAALETEAEFSGILARSRAMQEILRLVDLLRTNDAPVLVYGESGTGKELVARAIHSNSHRNAQPFVAVNCAAIPSQLIESELFGHARGAFTGAIRDRAGRFEAANGGTLFLDEIGDLPLELQGKLLRAIQESSFERVGENRTRSVDVRVIAATNKDLGRAVAESQFREDLYYRLRVIPVHVPPLRDRPEDIGLLLETFLHRIGRQYQRALRLSSSANRALLNYAWPGNVRELQNVVEYAVAVCEGQTIHLTDLPDEIRQVHGPVPESPAHMLADGLNRPVQAPEAGNSPSAAPSAAAAPTPSAGAAPRHLSPAEAAEARMILQTLQEFRFRKAEAAAALGMSRTTLWRKMKTYGL